MLKWLVLVSSTVALVIVHNIVCEWCKTNSMGEPKVIFDSAGPVRKERFFLTVEVS